MIELTSLAECSPAMAVALWAPRSRTPLRRAAGPAFTGPEGAPTGVQHSRSGTSKWTGLAAETRSPAVVALPIFGVLVAR
jgi:hypothetical protein